MATAVRMTGICKRFGGTRAVSDADFAVQAGEIHALLGVDPGRKISDMTVGERQRVELLKALACRAEILILDEPTAALAPPEVESLFASLRIAVMRGGLVVKTFDAPPPREEIGIWMVGAA